MSALVALQKTYLLKDYTPPDFFIEKVDLRFELGSKTRVIAQLELSRATNLAKPLVLDGECLTLVSVKCDEKLLQPADYTVTPQTLIIPSLPARCTLEIITEIAPKENTALSGLYSSGDMFCTQCEAQGFRRITYYLDRPDVMATFSTTIVADKTHYPILLSNGNKVASGEYDNNRHWVTWEDPFKKPCYLFALVAGPLSLISDTFVTQSGRTVALEIYVKPEDLHKCTSAMQALKNAMRWDEEKYGREYDLDIYMIVAVSDFNMGAMENKGLNIFNTKYILADEKTATDLDFQLIEAVIGHEYFHNWSGNRITCRDWFQLSLKEGLTVFREQQFSADRGSSAVKRISDACAIRTAQFAEDASPMCHSVRPEAYMEINNFYTATVYNKGAEVIRMLHTLLGEARFRQGMDRYFSHYDGQAVTVEDFISAFAQTSDIDLSAFFRWYQAVGTVQVKVHSEHDAASKKFTLHFNQTLTGKPINNPLVIPVNMLLLDEKGNVLPHTVKTPFVFNQSSQSVVFENVPPRAIPSLFANFSAPVQWHYDYTIEQLLLLVRSDPDPFNRWDAAQRICLQEIQRLMRDHEAGKMLVVSTDFIETYRVLLQEKVSDPEFFAQLLRIPSFQYIAQTLNMVVVPALIAARKIVFQTLSQVLQEDFTRLYQWCVKNDDKTFSPVAIGYRALKNICLCYCAYNANPEAIALIAAQYKTSANMTDTMGALSAVNHLSIPLRTELLADFYHTWKHDPLVVNKWLSLQGACPLPGTVKTLEALLTHEAFDSNNPNKVYALLNTFGSANPEGFHVATGEGYDFIADRVIVLNKKNPQVASRLIHCLTPWKHIAGDNGRLMKEALEKIQSQGPLSRDIHEIITKSLSG